MLKNLYLKIIQYYTSSFLFTRQKNSVFYSKKRKKTLKKKNLKVYLKMKKTDKLLRILNYLILKNNLLMN